MRNNVTSGLFRIAFVFSIAMGTFATNGTAWSQENRELTELKARMEALEKQNQLLMKLLESQGKPNLDASSGSGTGSASGSVSGSGSASGSGSGSASGSTSGSGSGEDDKVKKLVDSYMNEKDEKKKKADEEKKQKEEEEKRAREAEGFEVGKDLKMSASWKNGMLMETADKAFRIHVGGRTQIDAVFMRGDQAIESTPGGIGPISDAIGFRRARLEVDGTMYEVVDFFCEYDFMNTTTVPTPGAGTTVNVPAPTDLWFQLTQIPVIGNVRIGNQKPWIGFEHLTSSRWLNFIERSFSFDAFIGGEDNGFRPGISVFNQFLDERLFLGAGVYKNNRSIFGWNVGDGEYDVTGRIAALPWYTDDGRCLVHMGVGASHRDADDNQVRVRARSLLRNGPAALHTVLGQQSMIASGQDLVNPEFALVYGPFSMQSEYTASWVRDTQFPISPVRRRLDRGTAFFQGAYVEAHYFLTGEHRPYNRKLFAFDRVLPNENFFFVKNRNGGSCLGIGAWQATARYSYIDLDNAGIDAGNMHDVTVGLNWFLNNNMKVQWNYSWAHRDVARTTTDGELQGFGMRFAWDF